VAAAGIGHDGCFSWPGPYLTYLVRLFGTENVQETMKMVDNRLVFLHVSTRRHQVSKRAQVEGMRSNQINNNETKAIISESISNWLSPEAAGVTDRRWRRRRRRGGQLRRQRQSQAGHGVASVNDPSTVLLVVQAQVLMEMNSDHFEKKNRVES